jgi:hypothetical protein
LKHIGAEKAKGKYGAGAEFAEKVFRNGTGLPFARRRLATHSRSVLAKNASTMRR